MSGEPRQASLRRLRAFGIRPNRELGQNFLIDDNILQVIGTAAELEPDDVVLEVGGGLGVLSEFLAPEVSHLHVVEVDRSLEAPLREALEPFSTATLHLGDAVKLETRGRVALGDPEFDLLPHSLAHPRRDGLALDHPRAHAFFSGA